MSEKTPLYTMMQERYDNPLAPHFEAMQEWKTNQGYMGMYRVGGRYYHLAILVGEQLSVLQTITHDGAQAMVQDCHAIATYAGARPGWQDHPE